MGCTVAQNTVDMLNSGGMSLYYFTNGYSDEINWMGFDPYFNPDENGSATIDLQMRGFDFKLTPSKVNDCCQVEWMEKRLQVIPKTKVTTAFSGTTIPFASLENVADLRGATAGSSLVRVSATSGEHKFVNITAVSATSFTVDEAITAIAGDTIVRGGKHRIIGDCSTQHNETVTRQNEQIVKSYPVSIPIQIKFEKCDLSKDRLDYYTKDYDIQKFVNQEFGNYIWAFRSFFMNEIFFGKNIPSDGVNGSQSLSLITGLQQAQNCVNPTGLYADGDIFIHDVSTWDCCTTGNDCDLLQTFKKVILQKLRASGVYSGGKDFTALVNQSQIDELDLLAGAITDVF